MKINLKRNTGFFGMGTPLQILINNQKKGLLSHEENEALEVKTGDRLKVKYSILKSKEVTITPDMENKLFEVKANPGVFQAYSIFFVLFALFPIMFKSLWAIGLIIILCYLAFGLSILNKFYVIEGPMAHE